MRKRIKFLLIVVGVILALTVGLTTIAFASGYSEEGSADKSLVQTFTSKVAGILGLDEEQVADAFEQACQETWDEALEQHLQDAVESGRITEEEANQIREWWQSRPTEALEKFGSLGMGGGRHGMMEGGQRMPCSGLERHWGLSDIFDERLSGTITALSEEEGSITLTTEDGSEVVFQYTSNTRFVLQGVTAVAAGQTVEAWCWEDTEGDLTAKVVKVELPQDEEVAEDEEVT